MKTRLFKYFSLFIILTAGILYYMHIRSPYQIMAGETMNTYYRIKIRTNKPNNLLHNSVREELQRINEEMSVFDTMSEISQLNRDDSGEWIELSPRLSEVMRDAYRAYNESNGYFDPTVGKLVDLWGFGSSKNKKLPAPEEIKEALKSTGFNKLRFNGDFSRVMKTNPETYTNLSALAKGYAVDRIAKLLAHMGYTDYVVEIGGEVKAAGDRIEGGDGWNIAVVEPNTEANKNAYVVALKDYAVATSGDYRNFFYYNDKRYSHTISPKDGYPVEHNLASVTVFNASCMHADAMATAIMAMGEKKGLAFANNNNLAAILFVREGDGQFKALVSKKAQKLLEQE